jgi:hypothetical protein
MSSAITMLGPVIALVAWSMVMWLWMLVTRIPAIRQARMRMDADAPRGAQMALLPRSDGKRITTIILWGNRRSSTRLLLPSFCSAWTQSQASYSLGPMSSFA